jgi:hypothetical protein
VLPRPGSGTYARPIGLFFQIVIYLSALTGLLAVLAVTTFWAAGRRDRTAQKVALALIVLLALLALFWQPAFYAFVSIGALTLLLVLFALRAAQLPNPPINMSYEDYRDGIL